MRIVKLTSAQGKPLYVDAEQFTAVTHDGQHDHLLLLLLRSGHTVPVQGPAEEILRAMGLSGCGEHEKAREPEDGLSAVDRAAIEKTRTGPMATGELEVPKP